LRGAFRAARKRVPRYMADRHVRMLIRCGYEMTLRCQTPTPLVCLLSIHADRAADIRRSASVQTNPYVTTTSFRDPFGNLCHRLVAPPGDMTIFGDAVVEDDGLPDEYVPEASETPVQDLPNEALMYLTGSRYCETDLLSQIAWNQFGAVRPGWGRVQAICDFVHRHIRFDYMQANATRSAFGVFRERVGVCRDYAHLAIALCRCLNIPARYVNGHLGDIGVPVVAPMDFSAWIEVFLGGVWHIFDPRNNEPRIGRIVVARGRDAADIPLVNSFGPHVMTSFNVWTAEVVENIRRA
jgi:transglutaminase-like putative cysteine protease